MPTGGAETELPSSPRGGETAGAASAGGSVSSAPEGTGAGAASEVKMEVAWKERVLDASVHVNALLPCLIVWWTLVVVESAYLAVFLYEFALVAGPLATLWARGRESGAACATRKKVATLARSLTRPYEWRRCALITTGSLCVVGFGGFAVYLAVVQRELDDRGITKEIKDGTRDVGLFRGTPLRDGALLFLGVWFCTVNPVLEELFWRGYCYAEVGRTLNGRPPDAHGADLSLNSDPSDDDELKPRSRESRTRRALLNGHEQTAASRWLTSCYFGSFHGVVVRCFVGWELSLFVFAALATASRVWIWLGERAPFGFPFVVAFHAGADVAVVLVVSACDFGWTYRTAYVVALVSCAVLAAAGAGLLYVAWRHESFPRVPCALLARSQGGDGGSRAADEGADDLRDALPVHAAPPRPRGAIPMPTQRLDATAGPVHVQGGVV